MSRGGFPRWVAFGVLMLSTLVALGGLAGASSDSDRAQSRDFSVSATDRGGWTASGSGEVEFYGTQRRWKVFGEVEVDDGTLRDEDVYLAVRQNVNRTTADGPWYGMCYSSWGMTSPDVGCHVDRKLDPVDFGDVVYLQVGFGGEGEYFTFATRPGRGLRGVWLKICHAVAGPDTCGTTTYTDNPYSPGSRP